MFRSPLPASPHDEPAVSRESQRRRQHGPAARPLMMSSGSPGLGRRIEPTQASQPSNSSFSHLASLSSALSTRLSLYAVNASSSSSLSIPTAGVTADPLRPDPAVGDAPRLGNSAITWSAFDTLKIPTTRSSSRASVAQSVLLVAQRNSLSVWLAPLTSEEPLSELIRLTGDNRPEWGRSRRLVGAKILADPGALSSRLAVLVAHEAHEDQDHLRTTVAVYSLHNLELVSSTTVSGRGTEIQASGKAIAVGTCDPRQIHILSPMTLSPIQPPLTTLAPHPTSNKPVFTLSHRLLAYASDVPPHKGSPSLVRASGSSSHPGEASLVRGPASFSPGKVFGTLGSYIADAGAQGLTRSVTPGSGRSKLSPGGGQATTGPGLAAVSLDGVKRIGRFAAGFAFSPTNGGNNSDGRLEEEIEEGLENVEDSAGSTDSAHSRPSPDAPTQARPIPSSARRSSSSAFPAISTPFGSSSSRSGMLSVRQHSVVILDVLSTHPIAHFYLRRSPSPASPEPINHLSLSPSASQLLISQSPSHNFHIIEIRPAARGGSASGPRISEVRERYILNRGATSGEAEHVVWECQERYVGIGSGRGTKHVYAINPLGGLPAGHLQGKVLNPRQPASLSLHLKPIVRLRPDALQDTGQSRSVSVTSEAINTPDEAALQTSSAPRLSQANSISTGKALASSVFAFLAGPITPSSSRPSTHGGGEGDAAPGSTAQDILLFDPSKMVLVLNRCVLADGSVTSQNHLPSSAAVSLGSGVSRMMRSASMAADGTSQGGLKTTPRLVAIWPFGAALEAQNEVVLSADFWRVSAAAQGRGRKLQAETSAVAVHSMESQARWLSRAEIDTASSLPTILPPPIFLSRQFEFYAYDPATLEEAISAGPRALGDLPSTKILVRTEVLLTGVGATSSPALSPVGASALPAGGDEASLSSLSSSPSLHVPFGGSILSSSSLGSAPHSLPNSFEDPLASAMHTRLALSPRGSRPPIIPAYPNGDAGASRSWKSSLAGPIATLAGESQQVVGRVRRELGRRAAGSPSTSAGSSRRASHSSKYLHEPPSNDNGLSFEDGSALADPAEYAAPNSSGCDAQDGSTVGSSSFPSTSGVAETDNDRWEDDESLEGYRRAAVEDEAFDELIGGELELFDDEAEPVREGSLQPWNGAAPPPQQRTEREPTDSSKIDELSERAADKTTTPRLSGKAAKRAARAAAALGAASESVASERDGGKHSEQV